MKRPALLSALLALAVAPAAHAGIVLPGTITGGNRITKDSAGAPGVTVIAANAPVTGNGVLNSVTFGWSVASSCSAVKIKVFRLNGSNIDFLGERGPIAVTYNGRNDGDLTSDLTSALLSPPIAVQTGDYLGIAAANAGCGNAVGLARGVGSIASFDSDVTSTVSLASATQAEFALSLFASGPGSGETFSGILTGTGSLHGASGSNFKTGVQVTNPGFSTSHGHLVFHPAGHSAQFDDPSLGFSLDPGKTGSADDIIGGMGLTGLWSVDLYTATDEQVPVIITRIFNDAGAAGTTGFTEPTINPTSVTGGPAISVTGVLVGPPDLARYRFNIGIRTIGGPVGVSVIVKNPDGDVIHTFSTVYPADFYTQLSAHDFLGGFDLAADDSIVVTYSNGRAIIYGATTDNVTNDPSVQFMPFLSAIA